jgi:glyoxylase-like metal-dependent hydrolase (beta-lactamase superfamily II)
MPRKPIVKDPEVDDDDTGAPAEPYPLVAGVARALSPLVRRIVAPNPGLMTGPGTNTYLVGIDEIVVIDPGPDDDGHLDSIVGCGGDRIRWIAVTHTHPDHSPGAAGLKARTGAQVLGYGAKDGFKPDLRVREGHTIEATEFRLKALHTPGHASNHLCWYLEEERMLFSGDHLMQGSTVVIKPPDGDMAAYLESLERLRKMRLRAIAPGHGHLLEEPKETIDWYIAHRLEREQKVAEVLAERGTATIAELLPEVYGDVDPALHPVARYSLHAHLLKLAKEGRASGKSLTGKWSTA